MDHPAAQWGLAVRLAIAVAAAACVLLRPHTTTRMTSRKSGLEKETFRRKHVMYDRQVDD